MNIYDYKKVHCIGVGGIGVSAIAKFFVLNGAIVTGSDLVESELLTELRGMGVKVAIGHAPGNVPVDAELVVHSPAVNETNPEWIVAKELGVEVISYPEALGLISKTRPTIAVTGMHGKSTTTAMIGTVFAEHDPLVIVGSRVKNFSHGNVQFTKNRTSPFVVEACEYRGHMRVLAPQHAVITNIEEEHLDYYRDLTHIKETFQEFVGKIPAGGTLFVNAEDANSLQLRTTATRVTYGVGAGDVRGVAAGFEGGVRKVMISFQGRELGDILLRMPGSHNVRNALAAVACGLINNVSFRAIADALENFSGLWRRFEKVGERDGVPVYSDYGHHPSEIFATLQGARELFPDRRVVLLYQPHQYDRTKKLFDEFVPAMKLADFTIIADVYDVAGREEDRTVNSEMLAVACAAPNVVYGGNLDAARDRLLKELQPSDVVIVMGAGDVDRIARELV